MIQIVFAVIACVMLGVGLVMWRSRYIRTMGTGAALVVVAFLIMWVLIFSV